MIRKYSLLQRKKFSLIPRKKIAGNFEFKKYIHDIYNINQNSYEDFLQKNIDMDKRECKGLEKVFQNFFPIMHQKSKMKIEYLGYTIAQPRLTPEECAIRGVNYSGSMRVFFKVTNLQTNSVHKIESCIGDLPLITDDGTFIINGHEKVFVAQLQKCPGVIFSKEIDTTSNKKYAIAKIYPSVGSWIHLKFEKSLISVSIDKKKRFSIISLLLCFSKEIKENEFTPGYDLKEILDKFYVAKKMTYEKGFWNCDFNVEKYLKMRLDFDIYSKGKKIFSKGEIVTDEIHQELKDETKIQIPFEDISNMYLGEDIYDENTGEIFCEVSEKVSEKYYDMLKKRGFVYIYEVNNDYNEIILESVHFEKVTTKDEALNIWANSIKIGTHYGPVGLCWIFNSRFTDKRYYNLDPVGRKRLNSILGLNLEEQHLKIDDLIECMKQLVMLAEDKRPEDDIDSLSNKRFIGVGDIVENYFRMGLIKFEKNLREKVYNLEINTVKVADIFNLRICLYLVLDGFYKAAQMHDNNNYLSKNAQLRKVSSGFGKDRIASGLRDTNESKFGRMCVVQTPEGKKIGIIEHLALYTKIDKDGFLLTPYHVVIDGIATDDVVYFSPFDEKNHVISSKRLFRKLIIDGKIYYEAKSEYLVGRNGVHTGFFHKNKVNLINIADNQIFSISASLVPFPGNNDAYRTLSGSNMNTQGTPLVVPESPMIGTGMEDILGHKIEAKNAGIVKYVDSKQIIVELDSDSDIIDDYTMIANKRTNSATAITYKPLVNVGERVEPGDLIADGFSTKNGELALGKNLIVAYMSHPYCYEDAFVLSTKLIAQDKFSSLNIESHVCPIFETRNGPEKNTKDVPRIHSELLKNLDESGIVNVGVLVKGGDILVGKVTPSTGEMNLSSEYKLLHIIFGDKASDYTDNSLRLPHGSDGLVMSKRIIIRKGVEKDGSSILQDKISLDAINEEFNQKHSVIKKSLITKVSKLLNGCVLKKAFNNQKKGEIIDINNIDILLNNVEGLPIETNKLPEIKELVDRFNSFIENLKNEKQKKINSLRYGYELPEGVLKLITIDVATKKNIEPGDKLCGRYGNKGVVSGIFSEADMPYLADGTPVDMIINPCGLLARMNLGQVLETTLGYAIMEMQKRLKNLLTAYQNNQNRDEAIAEMKDCLKSILDIENLSAVGFSHNSISQLSEEEVLELSEYFYENGIKLRVEQFAKLTNEEISNFLVSFGADSCGKVDLYDGTTGEKYESKVLVGYQFIMKLCHLVSKKMHARSVGPYSLVNQQPLGGKARFGGQRCGEMEVWALQAHGAAMNTHEFMTTKSDDQKRRNQAFSHLTKVQRYSLVITGNSTNKIVGESFKLLMYELRAAGFDLYLINEEGEKLELDGKVRRY